MSTFSLLRHILKFLRQNLTAVGTPSQLLEIPSLWCPVPEKGIVHLRTAKSLNYQASRIIGGKPPGPSQCKENTLKFLCVKSWCYGIFKVLKLPLQLSCCLVHCYEIWIVSVCD